MLGTFVFFFGFTKLGMINKIFFASVISQVLVFYIKCNFYERIVDDLLT